MYALPGLAQAQTATLTITVDGPVSGAVGVQGPGGNVCNPNPGGGPTHGTCVFTYQVPATLRLAANSPTPSPGFFHTGTNDAAHCEFSTCDVVLTTDSAITATFQSPPGQVAAIQIGLLGDGKGNVGADNNQCQNFELGHSACVTHYAVGSAARFTGRSMPGNIFAGFSGTGDTSVCGGNSVCEFTVTGDSSVDATFSALHSVSLTPNPATVTIGFNAFFTATATFVNGMQRQAFNGNSPWLNHVPMDVARFSLAAVAVNDRLYALGGVDGSCPSSPCAFAPLGTVEVFNPLATLMSEFDQAWTPRAPMTTPREGLAAAAVDGRIYAFGGHTIGGTAVASAESYDPATDTWSAKASMSAPRAGMAAAAIGNTIYVVGGDSSAGGDSSNPLATVEAYDTEGNSWATKASMNSARREPAAAAVNGILYVIGGDGTGSVEAYDPATDAWTARAPMPGGGGSHVAAALNGLIYAVGGSSGTMKVYNPAVDSWATLGDMQFALRQQFAMAVLDGRLFAAGGRLADAAVATLSANRPAEATWWSSNSAVASVNGGNFGSVKGVSAGTATITARLVTIEGNAALTVNAPQPPQIFLGIPSSAFTEVGSNGNWACGTFSQNATGPWEVTINYGDGTGDMVTPYSTSFPSPCGGGPGTKGWFSFSHAYGAPGSYLVTVTVRNISTNTSENTSTTGSFNVQVQEGGGGEEECAVVTSHFTAIGSVSFTTVHLTLFDRTTGAELFSDGVPFGTTELGSLPPGSFRIELSVPVGYVVTPSSFLVDPVCGQPIDLNATVSASPAAQVSELIATVETFNLQQGIANSLDAKLQHILEALNEANNGNSAAVCNQLGAFINETMAQSGKKLTVEQATQLIAAAQQIKAVIGCP